MLVALDGLVQVAGGDAVKHCEIGVQQHFLSSHEMDQSLDLLNGHPLRHLRVVHVGFGLKYIQPIFRFRIVCAFAASGKFQDIRARQKG